MSSKMNAKKLVVIAGLVLALTGAVYAVVKNRSSADTNDNSFKMTVNPASGSEIKNGSTVRISLAGNGFYISPATIYRYPSYGGAHKSGTVTVDTRINSITTTGLKNIRWDNATKTDADSTSWCTAHYPKDLKNCKTQEGYLAFMFPDPGTQSQLAPGKWGSGALYPLSIIRPSGSTQGNHFAFYPPPSASFAEWQANNRTYATAPLGLEMLADVDSPSGFYSATYNIVTTAPPSPFPSCGSVAYCSENISGEESQHSASIASVISTPQLKIKSPVQGAVLYSSPTLVWEALPDAIGYTLDVADQPEGYAVTADNAKNNSYFTNPIKSKSITDPQAGSTFSAHDISYDFSYLWNDLSTGKNYLWRITPVFPDNIKGVGAVSNFAKSAPLPPVATSLTPGDKPPFDADPVFTFSADDSLVFSWENVDQAKGYNVEVYPNAEFIGTPTFPAINVSQVAIGTPVTVNVSDKFASDVVANGQYFWRVKSIANDSANTLGAPSEARRITKIPVPKISAPLVSSLQPAEGARYVGNESPVFQWNRVDNASGYLIEVNDKNDFTGTVKDTKTIPQPSSGNISVASNQWWRTNFGSGTYYWRVRSYDSKNRGGDPTPARSIVSVSLLGKPELTSPANNSSSLTAPTFSWTAVSDAATYELKIASGQDLGSPAVVKSYTITTIANPDFWATIDAGTYYWKVTAHSTDGREQASTVWQFTKESSGGGTTNSDGDGDGVDNDIDNCPTVANPNQLDTDDDGYGDVCDSTPGTGGVTDSDGDGIADNIDNCPTIANPNQIDIDGDDNGAACAINSRAVTGPSFTLKAGWNIITNPGTVTPLNADESVYGDHDVVWGYDNSQNEYVDLDGSNYENSPSVLAVAKGYWVYATRDETLTLKNIGSYTPNPNQAMTTTIPTNWSLLGNFYPEPLLLSNLTISGLSYTDARSQGKVSDIFVWDPTLANPDPEETTPGYWKILNEKTDSIPALTGFFIMNRTQTALTFVIYSGRI